MDFPIRVGIVGAGDISRVYVAGMRRYPQLELVAVADLAVDAATALASEAGVRGYSTMEEFLTHPSLDVVVNLTPPAAHADVTSAALGAGKHVYSEKPLAVSLERGRELIETAAAGGLTLAAAPDTFLGSAGQTARRAIDRGDIGVPVAASAFITHSKAELWHPNPTFLFQPGGGPLLDLGPYYVAALVNLLGPVATVSGVTRRGPGPRKVTAAGRRVDWVEVATTTHASASLVFDSGAVATLIASFDIWDSYLPRIEIYGSEGTLSVPDPNYYDGPVLFHRNDGDEWVGVEPVIPLSGEGEAPAGRLRGAGVADLARSLAGAPLRVGGELAFHVLEVLTAVETSSAEGAAVRVTSRPGRPAPYSDYQLAGAGGAVHGLP